MTDHNGIIIAGGDPAAKGLTICRFKILFRCYKNVCTGVQPQEIRAALFGQVIRHYYKVFLYKSQPFGFHCGGNTLEGLACTHAVCQQTVATVEHTRHRISLMRQEGNIRRHTGKAQVLTVILTGANGVIEVVVFFA